MNDIEQTTDPISSEAIEPVEAVQPAETVEPAGATEGLPPSPPPVAGEPATTSAEILSTVEAVASEPANEREGESQAEVENPKAETENPKTVPLARLKGVQHLLVKAEAERDELKGLVGTLREQLAMANQRAATECAARIKSTSYDIVPELVQGETVEQVEQALTTSRAAFAAARQAYARTIPTPQQTAAAAGNTPAPNGLAAQPTGSAVEMISRGLRQPANDINR
jgi:hypothetical protein